MRNETHGMNKQLSFIYGNATISFEVEYSPRRRTVQIAVQVPGKVMVTAPAGRTDQDLLDVVSKKGLWITQKLYMMKTMRMQPVVRELVSGESFLYLGRGYRLDLQLDEKAKKPSISMKAGQIKIHSRSMDQDYLRTHLIAWYRTKAAKLIGDRVRYYSQKMGVTPKSVIIKDQKKRWGSCTSTGNLYFNWRSILAPASVVDYIVVHELCHLMELKHSARFWSLLRAVLPEYEAKKQWLKENGVKLDVQK
jgi:predicted metal-dependent hydrolase